MIKLKLIDFRSHVLKSLCLILLAFFYVNVQAQDRSVSGKVTASNGGEPLPGVSVLVKGTGTGAVTNAEGMYTVAIGDDTDILVFSFIGMKTEEITVGSRSVIDLAMLDDVTALEEIVVVGYGEQKKSLLTGAISSIEAKEIETMTNSNVLGAIQGRSAGVAVSPTSGAPGSGFRVKIRGTGSNGPSNPLYIVDGLQLNNIDFIESGEIESMEILKDAAASAIYGANGANGVVIVTTKKGSSITRGLTYEAQFASQSATNNMDVMNTQQHAEYNNEAGIAGRTNDEAAGMSTTNWTDEILTTAPLTRHAIGFSDYTDKTSFFVRASWFNQDGIVGGDKANYQRTNFRFNLKTDVTDWLEFGTNNGFIHTKRRMLLAEDSEFGGVLSNGVLMDPATPVTYTGTLPAFVQALADGGAPLLTDANGNYYGLSEYVQGESYNPVASQYTTRGPGSTGLAFFGGSYINIKPIKDVVITSRLSYGIGSGNYRVWNPAYYFSATQQSDIVTAAQGYNQFSRLQWENWITYKKSFGNHNLTALAGMGSYEDNGVGLDAGAGNIPVESDGFGFVTGTADDTQATGGAGGSTILSYFGRVTYDFDNKYLFSATIRRDGSSMLADGNQWGTFPSVSAGYVVSNEEFWSVSAMSLLKFKASYGTNGSLSNLSPGQWQSVISYAANGGPTVYPDGTETLLQGATLNAVNNPELTWETSKQFNAGVELGFFDDKLRMNVDYFNKKTVDLITPGVVPGFVGNNAASINLGDVVNKGWEVWAEYRNNIGELDFSIGGNLTLIDNEVTRMNEFFPVVEGSENVGVNWRATAMEEGRPLWYFRGYQTDGIVQDASDMADYINSVNGGVDTNGDLVVDGNDIGYGELAPGFPKVMDINEDGTISAGDFTQIGNPHPGIMYATTITANWKGFDLRIFVQGEADKDVLLGINRTDRASANRLQMFYDNRWTPENPTNDWFIANGTSDKIYNSDFMIFDGSYLRFRQIQIGYTLPNGVISKLGMSNFRIYTSLENFFTITNYPGLDPEATSNDNFSQLSIDRGYYPTAKSVILGLSVKF